LIIRDILHQVFVDHFIGEVDARSGKPITSRVTKKSIDNGYSAGWGNDSDDFASYNFYGELSEVSPLVDGRPSDGNEER
jgi:carnitine O-acetyltransferase